jgi:hypothetical protein
VGQLQDICPPQESPLTGRYRVYPNFDKYCQLGTERIMAIAAKFTKLLNSCQEMEFSHLRPLVDRMFENADVALLDFAEKAENNMAQSLFFEAMNEVRKKRGAIEQHFYMAVKRSFDEFPSKPSDNMDTADQEPGYDSLSLIDTDELDTFVATQNAAGKLASRIMDRIFALKQRLAVINGGNVVEENQIPGGPAWLGTAFQQAVEQLELENKVRLVFIALFDKYVLSQADNLFDEYNKRLIQADILPNLRYEVRKQGGGIEIVEKQVSDATADRESDQIAESTSTKDQSPSDLGDEVFGRICELMSGRRAQGYGPAATAPVNTNVASINRPGGSQPAVSGGAIAQGSAAAGEDSSNDPGNSTAGTTLVSQISSLQSGNRGGGFMSSGDFIENIEVDEHLIERLQTTLACEREKIFHGVDSRKLSNADVDVIELVGMMFEYMLKEENLPNLVKALLSRLHTPLLKVAVVDRNFFTNNSHPARKLLNDMTAGGIRWVEEDQADRGIFPKMKEIVDKLLQDFEEDISIFEEQLEVFTKTTSELKQRASRVEQRTNEAASGQEKLQAARTRAHNEIEALCKGKAVATAAREFLQRIWADKLTFILLRNEQADQSKEWQQAAAFVGDIVASVAPPRGEDERESRQQALDQLQQEMRTRTATMQQADKEKLLNALFELQTQILSNPDIETVVPVAPPPDEEPAEESQEIAKSLSAEQQQMLDKLKTVPFGTWFEFQKPGQPKKRAKLSWRSTVTEKFMFVDQMGVKAAVVDMHELAECMLNGIVRIAATEKKPFVDRALNAIHRMLDHAA